MLLFDRAHNTTYWVNYSELKAQLRRRHSQPESELTELHAQVEPTVLAWRVANLSGDKQALRSHILREAAPMLDSNDFSVFGVTDQSKGNMFDVSSFVSSYLTFSLDRSTGNAGPLSDLCQALLREFIHWLRCLKLAL